MFEMKKHSVYFIMGSNNTTQNPKEVLIEAIAAGIDFFQYREKGSNALQKEERYVLAKELQTICNSRGIPFIVNDDIELAIDLQADGIHLGQADLTITEARSRLHSDCFIGISTSNLEEAIIAEELGADYIGVGPVYTTRTKEDAKKSIGLSRLREIKDEVNIPVVAIGGITENKANEVFSYGPDAIAVISAITQSKNIKSTIKTMKPTQ